MATVQTPEHSGTARPRACLDAFEAAVHQLRCSLTRCEAQLAELRWACDELDAMSRLRDGALGGHACHREALTACERRVALLCAAGKSNLEIAGELHVSVHTVKSQVKSILNKLDVSSRWQLRDALLDEAPRPA